MFTFIKKLFGFDQPTMKEAGVQIEQAPYKVPEPETVAVSAILPVTDSAVVAAVADAEPAPVVAVETQITDAVTQTPAKKARKPRAPKVEKTAVKKAAIVKKAAAIKATTKARTSRSKKA